MIAGRKMSIKNTVATWILFFFIIVPVAEATLEFNLALKLNQPIRDVMWDGTFAVAVIAAGIFLIAHFVHMTNDLKRYEAMERQRERQRG